MDDEDDDENDDNKTCVINHEDLNPEETEAIKITDLTDGHYGTQDELNTQTIKTKEGPKETVNSDPDEDIVAQGNDTVAKLDAAIADLNLSPQRPQRERKPVQQMSRSAGPGKFNTGQTHTQRGVCHLLTQGKKPDMEHNKHEAITMANAMACLVQTCSLKAGIKKWGARGKEAASAEMNQLHKRDCFVPVLVSSLTPQERRKALEALIFLTEKRDGKIKGRACANGSKQREWMSKEESASPTVSLPAVIVTAAMEVHEGREVAVVDIPNAFVQTENDGEAVHMKLRGDLAMILVELSPETCKDYLTHENGKPVLCVRIMKALHGMMQSSLLFYQKFVNDIKEIGFEINPCDPCAANKMVNGKQLTLTWHADNVKVSHSMKRVAGDFVEWIKAKCGGIAPVQPSRGKRHNYLAMTLDYSIKGKVVIDMVNHVKSMINDFKYQHELSAGVVPKTPAASHLFEARDDSPKLSKEKAEEFHAVVARALFASKRVRDDLLPTVTFLCARVKEPDEDDWQKPLRPLKCMKHADGVVKTLEMDNLSVVRWWADAAFAVHKDMKSHTGGIVTLGKGAAQSTSAKHELNAMSSTEAKLAGANEVVSYPMWTKHFVEAQGYSLKQTVLHQDNTSAILLEKNGKESSGKCARHINMRYFCTRDRIDNGNFEVQCCPTEETWGDCMSKPLQGKQFKKFFNLIMNE